MTPNALGSFSRLMIDWTSVTKRLPIITGSMLLSGIDPCAPTPWKVLWIASEAELTTPSFTSTVPTGNGATCAAKPKTGLGQRVTRPEAIIASAPLTVPLDGWQIHIRVTETGRG